MGHVKETCYNLIGYPADFSRRDGTSALESPQRVNPSLKRQLEDVGVSEEEGGESRKKVKFSEQDETAFVAEEEIIDAGDMRAVNLSGASFAHRAKKTPRHQVDKLETTSSVGPAPAVEEETRPAEDVNAFKLSGPDLAYRAKSIAKRQRDDVETIGEDGEQSRKKVKLSEGFEVSINESIKNIKLSEDVEVEGFLDKSNGESLV